MDDAIFGTDISNQWIGDGRGDLKLVSGEDNLEQAIYNRLMTDFDELEHLLYPDYGTRSILEEPNTPDKLALIIVYIEDSLAHEPRLRSVEVTDLEVGFRSLKIHINVVKIGENVPTNMIIGLEADGGNIV